MGLKRPADTSRSDLSGTQAETRPVLLMDFASPEARRRLTDFIGDQMQAEVEIESIERLSGGAIQENWMVRAVVSSRHSPGEERRRWVLRTDAPSAVADSLSRGQEFAVQSVAWSAGVLLPRPLWCCRDRRVLGREFFLMEHAEGVTAGRRLTREPELVPDPAVLAAELGANLARLHSVTPPRAELDFLPVPATSPALETVRECREYLDRLGLSRPVLEYGLRWCEMRAPAVEIPPQLSRNPTSTHIRERRADLGRRQGNWTLCLIHRDYRTGNYLVRDGHLAGVLDWEFARWGDPREDLGWFTARCWRFARVDRDAGGIAGLEPFLRAYAELSGCEITREELRYWQVLAHARWAVLALEQAWRHLSGQQHSLELSLTGRLVPELEMEILNLLGAGRMVEDASTAGFPANAASLERPVSFGATAGGEPGARELLAAARRSLLENLLPALPEPLRYEARMIANAMAISIREYGISEQAECAEHDGLARLGVIARRADGRLPARMIAERGPQRTPVRWGAEIAEGNLRLAQAIRGGEWDEAAKRERLLSHLAETTRLRLAISNPRRLAEGL